MIRLQKKIAHLQNVLDRRYTINNPLPVLIPIVLPPPEILNLCSNLCSLASPPPEILTLYSLASPPTAEPIDEFTDVPEEEIQQREDEQKALEEQLARLELDKLIKKNRE